MLKKDLAQLGLGASPGFMRGEDRNQQEMFSYGSLEERVPSDHPLRQIRAIVDKALVQLSPTFDAMYTDYGRPSIPPERLLRALLIQTFYSVRSERMLMEQLAYNLLFRWFVGLGMNDEVWHATVFTIEAGSAAGQRCRRAVLWPCAGRGEKATAAVERALYRRWHADRGMGGTEELSAEVGR